MGLRVISGMAKGMVLVRPKGVELRPTTDRVREALFSILMPRLPDARFCDLFAGTGANGIEALSRGAASAVFVDSEPRAMQAIEENLTKTRLAEQATLIRARIPAGLSLLTGPFDLIFADPPYDDVDHGVLLDRIARANLLAPCGWVIVEHRSHTHLPEAVEPFTQFRRSTYGESALTFYA